MAVGPLLRTADGPEEGIELVRESDGAADGQPVVGLAVECPLATVGSNVIGLCVGV